VLCPLLGKIRNVKEDSKKLEGWIVNKSRFVPALLLILGPVGSVASPLALGSLATNNVAIFGYDKAALGGSILDSASTVVNVSGNAVSPSVQSGGLTYGGSFGAVTSGSVLTNAESDFASLLTQLGPPQTYTPLTITSGAVNNFSTPGFYALSTSSLGANTVINITAPGQYVFEAVGLTMSGVTVNAKSSSLSSDNVFWYDPSGVVSISNSNVFGDIVQAGAGNSVLQTSAGSTDTLTGRFLSGGFFTTVRSSQNSTLNIVNQGSGVSPAPEPSTFAFLSLGLGLGLVSLRRRKA
jgi:hypothetical protein